MLRGRHLPEKEIMGKTEGREEETEANRQRGNSPGGFLSRLKDIIFKRQSTAKSAVREWTESIIIAFFLAMVIRTFIIQAFKIPTGSMRMTLLEGDKIFVNKLRYGPKVPFTKYRLPGFTKPQRGDVIVFIFPEEPKKDYIKRLIALGGETVEIKDGRILIDGKLVEDPEIAKTYYVNLGTYGQTNQSIKVPKNFYFVLGDNSPNSRDSRYWGFVPENNLIGRAEFIWWPLTRIHTIH